MCLLLFWHLISGLKWSWRIKCCLISYTVSAPCLPCGVQNICLISDVGSGWGSSARQECFWNQPFPQFIFLLVPFLLSPLLPSCKNHVFLNYFSPSLHSLCRTSQVPCSKPWWHPFLAPISPKPHVLWNFKSVLQNLSACLLYLCRSRVLSHGACMLEGLMCCVKYKPVVGAMW